MPPLIDGVPDYLYHHTVKDGAFFALPHLM